MIINNVRIFLNERTDSRMKATATVLLNNQILLQSIRIFAAKDDESDLRVSYPVQWMVNGSMRHCMYPSNAESRARYDAAILKAYQKVLSGEAKDNTVVYCEDNDRPGYEITRAGVYPFGREESFRARVGIELDSEIWLRGMFMVVRNNGALFLNMPRREMAEEGKYMAYFHPVDQDARDVLTDAVMPYYDEIYQRS